MSRLHKTCVFCLVFLDSLQPGSQSPLYTCTPSISCWIGTYTNDIFTAVSDHYEQNTNAFILFPIPMSFDKLHAMICKTIAHEIGHSVGLLHEDYMDTQDNGHHNSSTHDWMMNAGASDIGELIRFWDNAAWKDVCRKYMRFILPSYGYDEWEE